MKMVKRLLILTLFCSAFAMGNKVLKENTSGRAWVAITYKMAEDGASNEKLAGVGAFGVLHAAMEGAVWGTVVGGPAGTIAGIVWGL